MCVFSPNHHEPNIAGYSEIVCKNCAEFHPKNLPLKAKNMTYLEDPGIHLVNTHGKLVGKIYQSH